MAAPLLAMLSAAALLPGAGAVMSGGVGPQILHNKKGMPLKTTLTMQPMLTSIDPLAVCNDGSAGAKPPGRARQRRWAPAARRGGSHSPNCGARGRWLARAPPAAAPALLCDAACARPGAHCAPPARSPGTYYWAQATAPALSNTWVLFLGAGRITLRAARAATRRVAPPAAWRPRPRRGIAASRARDPLLAAAACALRSGLPSPCALIRRCRAAQRARTGATTTCPAAGASTTTRR